MRFSREVALGMRHMHTMGYIHKRLRAEHVLMSSIINGSCKVRDKSVIRLSRLSVCICVYAVTGHFPVNGPYWALMLALQGSLGLRANIIAEQEARQIIVLY